MDTWHYPLEIICCNKKVKLQHLHFAELTSRQTPNLLGLNDFFDHFYVLFDPMNKGMEIKPRKK